jgi:deoxyribose-phosphate aldolase
MRYNGLEKESTMGVCVQDIADMIDHSLLRPELTEAEVREGCRIARENLCVSVCVKPADVRLSAAELAGSKVLVTTVVGFPHGSSSTATKLCEARETLADGAVELDMVLNIGKLRSGETAFVEEEIRLICALAHEAGARVKVILENHYLDDAQKVIACRLAESAGADFVKTSTGFAASGATIADLKLMRATCSPRVLIKAAGGVRTLDDALAVRAVGTTRFGATQTVAILREAKERAERGVLGAGAAPARLSSER